MSAVSMSWQKRQEMHRRLNALAYKQIRGQKLTKGKRAESARIWEALNKESSSVASPPPEGR